MKLEGSFDTFPLRELIDMVVYSSVTGVLNIYGPGESGHLYFRDSVLYHVDRGPTIGIDALAELLELASANFSFVSDIVTDQESLHGAVSTHLQIAERLSSRWRQIRAYVPHLELVPHLVGTREGLQRRVNPAHLHLLDLIDGRATLRQVAAGLGWSTVDTAEALAEMSVDGFVELRSARQASALAEPSGSANSEPAHRGEGLFDRVLSRAPTRAVGAEPVRPLEGQRIASDDLILRMLRS